MKLSYLGFQFPPIQNLASYLHLHLHHIFTLKTLIAKTLSRSQLPTSNKLRKPNFTKTTKVFTDKIKSRKHTIIQSNTHTHTQSFAGNIAPGIAHRTAQDEESEALLDQFFHDFFQSGEVTGTVNKLQNSGEFERDGEINVFGRVSKSIVDTLAKHWTTTMDAEIVALSVVSTQFLDNQHKHHKYLQFLALSKCNEEMCSRQSKSLQIIMEHGEKLAAMIQLRDLENLIRQKSSVRVAFTNSSSQNELSGSIWDPIQSFGVAFNLDSSEVAEQNEEITQKLSSNLLAVAKRHEGYQTLWNLCSDHNDLELLRSLMVERVYQGWNLVQF